MLIELKKKINPNKNKNKSSQNNDCTTVTVRESKVNDQEWTDDFGCMAWMSVCLRTVSLCMWVPPPDLTAIHRWWGEPVSLLVFVDVVRRSASCASAYYAMPQMERSVRGVWENADILTSYHIIERNDNNWTSLTKNVYLAIIIRCNWHAYRMASRKLRAVRKRQRKNNRRNRNEIEWRESIQIQWTWTQIWLLLNVLFVWLRSQPNAVYRWWDVHIAHNNDLRSGNEIVKQRKARKEK